VRLTGVHAVREALRARRRPLYRLRVRAEGGPEALRELRALAHEAGVAVSEEPPERLDAAGGPNPQGVVLEAGPLPELSLAALAEAGAPPRTLVALDGVEDPQNLGAIARVAEGAGATGLVITRRRAPPLGAAVARASAGAIEWLPVARVPNLRRALQQLQERGFWVFGAEVEAPLSLWEVPGRWLEGGRVVVLGAEGRGLRHGTSQVLDHRVRIPMAGRVGSLNVAAAAAVVLFELARRGSKAPPTGVP